jgi:hypothetical protein
MMSSLFPGKQEKGGGMPNHITNILYVEGDEYQKVFGRIAGEEGRGCIDFNRIVQMPEIMESESSIPTLEDMAMFFLGKYPIKDLLSPPRYNAAEEAKSGNWGNAAEVLKQHNMVHMLTETNLAGDLSDEHFEILVKYMRALRQFGHCSWYEWSRDHWGTKWNAYNQSRIDERTIQFDTAWSTPMPIWEKLSEMFPDTVLSIRWADEDFGSNTGTMKVQNGEIVEGGPIKSGSPEAYRNACDVIYGGELPDHKYWKPDGTVGYKDDEEE